MLQCAAVCLTRPRARPSSSGRCVDGAAVLKPIKDNWLQWEFDPQQTGDCRAEWRLVSNRDRSHQQHRHTAAHSGKVSSGAGHKCPDRKYLKMDEFSYICIESGMIYEMICLTPKIE